MHSIPSIDLGQTGMSSCPLIKNVSFGIALLQRNLILITHCFRATVFNASDWINYLHKFNFGVTVHWFGTDGRETAGKGWRAGAVCAVCWMCAVQY